MDTKRIVGQLVSLQLIAKVISFALGILTMRLV